MKALETIDLGNQWIFEVSGKTLKAQVTLFVHADDMPYDGDIPEDVEAFERGDFQMYVAEVRASFHGMAGEDILGGIAASKLEDITACIEEHGMVANALEELARNVSTLLSAVEAA